MSSPSRKKTPRQPLNAENEPVIVELVRQDDSHGCGIACIAMVMQKSYAEVEELWYNDFTKDGITTKQICDFLGEHDYGIIYKTVMWSHSRTFGRRDRKSTRLNSSHITISYAVF